MDQSITRVAGVAGNCGGRLETGRRLETCPTWDSANPLGNAETPASSLRQLISHITFIIKQIRVVSELGPPPLRLDTGDASEGTGLFRTALFTPAAR